MHPLEFAATPLSFISLYLTCANTFSGIHNLEKFRGLQRDQQKAYT